MMVEFRPSSEVVIFLYQCVVYTYYNVIPQLILRKVCLRSEPLNSTMCQPGTNLTMTDEIHQEASRWWSYVVLCDQLPAIFTILVSGILTDIIGRRKYLLAFPLVDILASIVFFLNSFFVTSHPVFLIPGFVLLSLFGESQGVAYVCNAFIADIDSRTENWTTRMALVEAAMAASGILASLSTGYILQGWGFCSVFALTLCTDGLLFIYVYFYLGKIQKPENSDERSPLIKPKEESTAELQVMDKMPVQRMMEGNESADAEETNAESSLSVYVKHAIKLVRVLLKNRKLSVLILIFVLIYFGAQGEVLVQTLYLKNEPFSFTPQYIGYYGAVQAASRTFGTILISQLSFHLLHLNDYALVVISCLSQISSYVVIGCSTSRLSVFRGTALSFALSLSFGAIRSLLTKEVFRDSAGAILSLVASLSMLMALLSNLVSVWTYEMTLVTYSGVVYFVLAAFSAVAMVITVVTYIFLERKRK